ncbi:MAG: hypothetical protein HYX80_10290 [Chloroflexi bacterium]|nr:hypothetical protein [Chloroflexota bacterium]
MAEEDIQKEEQEGQQAEAIDQAQAEAGDRVSELERAMAEKEAEIARLMQSSGEMEKRVAALSDSLSKAIASYKAAVIRANPEVIDELVTGETVESIDESLAKGKELVSRVKRGVEAAISQTRVPAGAPERTAPDLSTLSPREKIQYAIGRK